MAYTPTYITGEEIRSATNDPILAAMTENALEAEFGPIHKAELQIDRFCGYWDRFGGQLQARVFPRTTDVDADGVSEIPEAVKFATLYQIEYNNVNKPDMDHGIENDERPKRKEVISPRARQQLQGYVMKGGRIEFIKESPAHHL
jgi:hypothetical protein